MFEDKFESEGKNSSKKKWLETTTKFLKGNSYQDLYWEFSKDISIEPYYTQEESSFSHLEFLEQEQIALNEPVSQARFWYNQPFVKVKSIEKSALEAANKEVRQVLMSGAEGVFLDLRNVKINELDLSKLEILLFEVALPYCSCSFFLDVENEIQLEEFYQTYISYSEERGFEKDLLTGGILLEKTIDFTDSFFTKIKNEKTSFRIISISLNYTEDEAQQIANTLLQVKNIVEKSSKEILKNIQFVIEAKDSFFPTIAKIRALHWLLLQMYALYEVEYKPYFHSITTRGTDSEKKSETQEDSNWNLIRNTTQALSCILGGTNALTVLPHKEEEENKTWANRIARNISVMLKEESFLDKNADPIAGTYYVEQMTEKLIELAWQKFQNAL